MTRRSVGQPPRVGPDQAPSFALAWANPRIRLLDICAHFRLCRAAVYDTATRLGLPRPRCSVRDTLPAQLAFPGLLLGPTRTSGVNAANHRTWDRSAARQLAKLEAALAAEPKMPLHAGNNVPATPYRLDAQGERCSLPPGRITYACPLCGCRSLSAEGHPSCARAAA